MQGFVDGAADGHDLTHRFHGGGQVGDGAGEFFKGEAGDFRDDIVDGRFKRRGRDLGDVIVQLIQRVADGEFGGDFRDGEAGGFGGQRGRP